MRNCMSRMHDLAYPAQPRRPTLPVIGSPPSLWRNPMTHASVPTVLVLGANGRFGLAAAQAFAAAGWHVLAQVRRDAVAGMPKNAELVRAPLDALADALAARPAPRAMPSVVVHAVNPVYTRWDEEALPAARAGMDLAERLGARFMLPGNVYNYGAG